MKKVLVSPIAYNEGVKIENVIKRFLKSPSSSNVDYLVIDDASTDGTPEMIQGYSDEHVKTLRHEKQQGVGAAIRTAINYAIEHNYEILVIMAGNDKDDPNEIPFLLDPILKEGYDFVQGSRYLGQCRVGGDMPFYRKLATRLHPMLMSFLVKQKVTDSTNGFRAFKLSILKDERINVSQDWLNEYELEPYLLFKTIVLGHKFKEAPVTKIYPSKKLGYTKMKPVVGWWSILRPLIYLGLGIKK